MDAREVGAGFGRRPVQLLDYDPDGQGGGGVDPDPIFAHLRVLPDGLGFAGVRGFDLAIDPLDAQGFLDAEHDPKRRVTLVSGEQGLHRGLLDRLCNAVRRHRLESRNADKGDS